MFNEYQHLRIPGPTPISPEVQREMSRTIMGHRSAAFSEILGEAAQKAKNIFQTKEEVFIVASSGTGALEMAVSNVVEPEEQVLVIVTGVFGQRFVKIAKAFGANVLVAEFPEGSQADPQRIKV